MRNVLAVMLGLFVTVFVLAGMTIMGAASAEKGEPVSAEVMADRTAPSARNDPMRPVTGDEGSRRATLHSEVGAERTAEKSTATYVAPPVITDIRRADDDDELTRQLFGDNDFVVTPEPVPAAFVPEPQPEPAPEPATAEPEPEPEREPEPVAVEEPAADPLAPYYDLYGDRLRMTLPQRAYEFDVLEITPELQEHSWLGRALDGVSRLIASPAHADGFTYDHGDPFVQDYMSDHGPATRMRVPPGTLHTAPLPSERSAARPALVGVDSLGRAFATSDHHDARVAARAAGRQVLARAGDLVYARLLYGFNSDDIVGRPIFAIVTDILPSGAFGPLHNARIQGTIAYARDNAAISFNRILLADGRELPMAGIAISADAARAGVAANVDRHRLQRYGALFLAGLLEGVGEVVQTQVRAEAEVPDTIIVTGDGEVNIGGDEDDELSSEEILYGALAPVGRNIGAEVARGASRPPTISAPAGHVFGIVIVDTLVFDPAVLRAAPAFNPRTGGLANAPAFGVTPATIGAVPGAADPSQGPAPLGQPRVGQPLPGDAFQGQGQVQGRLGDQPFQGQLQGQGFAGAPGGRGVQGQSLFPGQAPGVPGARQ